MLRVGLRQIERGRQCHRIARGRDVLRRLKRARIGDEIGIERAAGAGIVADSDPSREELETRNKAAALLQAVAVARFLRDEPAVQVEGGQR